MVQLYKCDFWFKSRKIKFLLNCNSKTKSCQQKFCNKKCSKYKVSKCIFQLFHELRTILFIAKASKATFLHFSTLRYEKVISYDDRWFYFPHFTELSKRDFKLKFVHDNGLRPFLNLCLICLLTSCSLICIFWFLDWWGICESGLGIL